MEFTIAQFNKYIQPDKLKYYHPFYDQSVKKYHAIKVHANGEKPGDLLTKRRPSESEKIQKYREEIYVPVTKSCFTKVYNSLMKIRKSQDWSIKFGEDSSVSTVREGETLFDYLILNFPKYTSITNWYFQIGLKQQLVDTNAKVFVMPINLEAKDNEYLKPYPFIYNSENVIDYEYKKYYVLKSIEKIRYVQSGTEYTNGCRYYVVTDTNIQTFDQVSFDHQYREAFNYKHGLGYVPVYDMKGIVFNETLYQTLYESKIMGMIPFLDEATREYSDMQAEVVQHVHSTLWAYQPHDCKRCGGTGYEMINKSKAAGTKPSKETCGMCGGKGIYPFNPYENLVLGKPPAGETNLPSPPAGFITKDTSIVSIQRERIEGHFFQAYASINMEFLASTPLNQSGLAKEVDKEELNNFVHGVAEDGVELLDNIVFCINDYRYKTSVKDDSKRLLMLPVINVPQKFDLLGDEFMLDVIRSMKEAKMDAAIINAAEIEFAAKRFSTDEKISKIVSMKLALDPFAGQPEDVVNSRDAFGLVKKTDSIIHANIHSFIERAMEENAKFDTLPKKQQIEILRRYAEELIESMQPTETEEEVIPPANDPVE